jgi:predicted metal-dependent enzyme (double-stranded beta helix superfamily)
VVYDAGIVKPLLPLLLACAGPCLAQTTVVLENDQVRVLKAHAQPHQPSRLHEHTANRVMVYLDAGTEDIAYEGGKTVKLAWKPGEVEWSPISGKHVATITSDKTVTIIEVELKNTGSATKVSAPLDPPKVDPKHYKVEFENQQVRVLRARLGPGESAPQHEHSLNRVVTYLTPQNIQVTEPGGKTSVVQHAREDVSWAGAARHAEVNLSKEPFEVVVVELK